MIKKQGDDYSKEISKNMKNSKDIDEFIRNNLYQRQSKNNINHDKSSEESRIKPSNMTSLEKGIAYGLDEPFTGLYKIVQTNEVLPPVHQNQTKSTANDSEPIRKRQIKISQENLDFFKAKFSSFLTPRREECIGTRTLTIILIR